MLKLRLLLISLVLVVAHAEAKSVALLLEVKGAIGPATQEYLHYGLNEARKSQASLLILQIDTPGGLSDSMRGIIQDILSSPIPVISYVAPSGARAASAGTYIVYASHIAAMAPGTNLGAATPVMLSQNKNASNSKETLKEINDAQAYIRSLAQLRQRNVKWAEQAVTQAASLSASEALQLKVIDLIANDIPDLLAKIDGKSVQLQGKTWVIHSQALAVQRLAPNSRTRFLSVITDPRIAYSLLMIGICGLFFEFMSPGFILPGVVGGIALLIGLYALQLLPINYTGFTLIILGLGCIIAEIFISAFGSLGIGGIIAFLMGSIMLIKPGATGFNLPISLIIAVTILIALFFLIVLNLALRSRRRRIVSGKEGMIGSEGVVVFDNDIVWIHVAGERWQAVDDQSLKNGQRVQIIGIKGLKLKVRPL